MTMLNWKEIQKGDNGDDGVGINKDTCTYRTGRRRRGDNNT